MESRPVFFDPEGRRHVRLKGLVAILGFVISVIGTAFVLSLLFLPALPHDQKKAPKSWVSLPDFSQIGGNRTTSKVRRDLYNAVAKEQKKFKKPDKPPEHIVAAFYATWEETGIDSLNANASKLTHVIPAWLSLRKQDLGIDYTQFDLQRYPRNKELISVAREHGLRITPMLSNAAGENGGFDPDRVARLVNAPLATQEKVAQELRAWLVRNQFQGINFDFEDLKEGMPQKVTRFFRVVRQEFDRYGLGVSMDLEIGQDEWPLDELSDACNWIVLMDYDEHEEGGWPGPISSMDWCEENLQRALTKIPSHQLVLGIGNYCYDWTEGKKGAQDMTYQEALATAKGYREEKPDKIIRLDPDSLNSTFAYRDDDDKRHTVWMLDAVSAYNEWYTVRDYGIRGGALWTLGSEDPGVWTFFDKAKVGSPLQPKLLEKIAFPDEVSFTGKGEILNVLHQAQNGARKVAVDSESGQINEATYSEFPFPLVLQKRGFKPKKLVLSFDDGPDPEYTGKILDQLKALKVPAVFFFIGKNVEENTGLVARAYNEGHEIGSHTFLHPNMGLVTPFRAKLEMDATQRAIESVTGHSTRLFRPPYNADSEPHSPVEVTPVTIADGLGYVTVGENVDPNDWYLYVDTGQGTLRPKTADDIVKYVVEDVERRVGTEEEGNVILLHDAGGNREQTVLALPRIVKTLQAKGFEFVGVHDLLGWSRAQEMPEITAKERMTILLDKAVFGLIFGGEALLATLFLFAIGLGVARIVITTPLALIYSRGRERRLVGVSHQPSVSVLIAAYNEEAVVVRTIKSVLRARYPIKEILVIDDGSKDATAKVVEESFADSPLVRLIRKENGGKASALNLGIESAVSDILVCIDADTQLDPDAIAMLARHFVDEKVAAVAGNVRVGNQINVLTKWQAIEYTTSQNLDRRAYALLNAITVVPGAIGAWRRAAVLQVGGYTTDTLAEDMDLTWRLRRAGFRLENEAKAIAYTEAPDTFGAFFRQRFRWAYGTLQCLYKHKGAVFHYGWFGGLALPTLWLFQILFQAIAPLVDLQVLYSIANFVAAFVSGDSSSETSPMPQAMHDLQVVGYLYALFFAVELVAAAVAFRLEKQRYASLWWLFLQRFVYRQIMYGVVYKSFLHAIRGGRTGWGKVERKGTVAVPPDSSP